MSDAKLYPNASDVLFAEHFTNKSSVIKHGFVKSASDVALKPGRAEIRNTISTGSFGLSNTTGLIPSGNKPVTIIVRFKNATDLSGFGGFVSFGNIGVNGKNVWIGTYNNGNFGAGNFGQFNADLGILVDDKEHEISYVYPGGTSQLTKIYFDGTLVYTSTPFTLDLNDTALILGRIHNSGAYYGSSVDILSVEIISRSYDVKEIGTHSAHQIYTYMDQSESIWCLDDKIGITSPFITSDRLNTNPLELGDGFGNYAPDLTEDGYDFVPGATGEYLRTQDVVTLGDSYTLALWCTFHELLANSHLLVFCSPTGSSTTGIFFNQYGDSFFFYHRGGGPNIVIANSLHTGMPMHITVTCDGTSLKAYIDGVLVGTGIAAGSIDAAKIQFGSGPAATCINAKMHSIFFSNKPLNATQVKDLYNKGPRPC